MSWTLAEDWLSVAGLLLLAAGTGAQAWAAVAEYRRLIGTLTDETRTRIQGAGPLSQAFMAGLSAGDPQAGLVARWIVTAVVAIVVVPRKMTEIRSKGGDDALELAKLLRLAGVWGVLMLGAILVLAAAVIQLVLAYFPR